MTDEESSPIGIPGQSEAPPARGGCLLTLAHLCVFMVGLVIGASVLDFLQPRPQGQLTACKSNCKNIATALEMYASDNKGLYPAELSKLTEGSYLRLLPTCPASSEMTYTNYRVYGRSGHFYFSCVGNNHAEAYLHIGKDSENYPGYHSDKGLEEHP